MLAVNLRLSYTNPSIYEKEQINNKHILPIRIAWEIFKMHYYTINVKIIRRNETQMCDF